MKIYRHDTGKVLLLILVLAVIIAILFPPQARAQGFHFEGDSTDSFTGIDKLAHLTKGAVTYLAILRVSKNNDFATWSTIALATAYEIYDGHRECGFSWKDVCADIFGIICAQVILEVFDAPIYIRAVYGNGSGRLNLTVAF